jgi:hypothetical protein
MRDHRSIDRSHDMVRYHMISCHIVASTAQLRMSRKAALKEEGRDSGWH